MASVISIEEQQAVDDALKAALDRHCALPTSRLSRPRRTAPLLLVVCGEVEAKWSGGEQVAEGPEGRALRRDVHRCRNRPGGTNM
jgi:hypothetical protein